MSSEFSSQESPSSSSTLGVSEYFKNSRHFSIGDNGNFSTVHGDQIQQNYYNTELKKRKFIVASEEEEAEYEQFPEIKRADFVAIRNIHRSDGWVHDTEQQKSVKLSGERTVVAGDVRIGGVTSKCLVVQYSGQEAGELWKEDFQKFGGFRCPENAQLVAINLSNIPMLILTGDLVPLANLMNQVDVIGRVYLRSLAIQMGCLDNHFMWMDTSRGVFCRGPEGPECAIEFRMFDFGDLPSDAELVKEEVLMRYLASRSQDRKFLRELSSVWERGAPQIKVERPTVISTLTNTILAVGPSGVWEVERPCCLGEKEELANGATRFTLHHNGRRLELWLEWCEPMCDWVAQAIRIFCAHGISLEDNLHAYKLVLPRVLRGMLSSSKAKQRRREGCPPIYLFVPPLSTSIFWSFDPDGQNPIGADLCHYLGLPISLDLRCTQDCWPTGTSKALLTYQIARGFDPNTTEFAQHNGYPIYEIAEQSLPSRFEQVEDSIVSVGPTETSLHSVPPEEFDDMFLGVMFGDVQPEGELVSFFCRRLNSSLLTDLAANTTTQGSALQKDSMGIPGTAHSDRTLPEDPKSISPSEIEDAIPMRKANVGWSRFIPTFSWAALEDSDIHSAGF